MRRLSEILQATAAPGPARLRFVRAREGHQIVLTTYGRSTGFCIDPIEKKPLNHFLPGTAVLSFGTAGCNLGCRFCQNWDISKSREIDTRGRRPPQTIAAPPSARLPYRGVHLQRPGDLARVRRRRRPGLPRRRMKTVAVTAGYITPSRGRPLPHMDAANVDLKGFTEHFYKKICGRPSRGGQGDARLPEARDLGLVRGHDAPHPRSERLGRGDRSRVAPGSPTRSDPTFRSTSPPSTPTGRCSNVPHTPATPRSPARARSRSSTACAYVYVGNVHDNAAQLDLLPRMRRQDRRRPRLVRAHHLAPRRPRPLREVPPHRSRAASSSSPAPGAPAASPSASPRDPETCRRWAVLPSRRARAGSRRGRPARARGET